MFCVINAVGIKRARFVTKAVVVATVVGLAFGAATTSTALDRTSPTKPAKPVAKKSPGKASG